MLMTMGPDGLRSGHGCGRVPLTCNVRPRFGILDSKTEARCDMREDAVSIVTGAGSGIGRATALRLASDGATVVAADVNEEAALETRSLGADSGGEVTAERVDVRDPTEVSSLVSRTVERFGRLDCMIANAGVLLVHPFIETTPNELDHVLAVNVKGVYFCGQAAARAMIASG